MRVPTMALLALGLLMSPLAAAEPAWTVGLHDASTAAAAAHLPILADFTGSDWCSWCRRLKQEVFDTPEFADWAKRSAILMEVDFPEQKPLAAAQRKENQELAERYGVDGFPTVLLLRADGSEIGRLGYMPGGPKAWIAAAERILADNRR